MLRIQNSHVAVRHTKRVFVGSRCDTLNTALARCVRPATVATANLRNFHRTSAEQALPERHGTTILCVRKSGKVCMMGDGMVSQGSVIVKPNVVKIRRILPKDRKVSPRHLFRSFFLCSMKFLTVETFFRMTLVGP